MCLISLCISKRDLRFSSRSWRCTSGCFIRSVTIDAWHMLVVLQNDSTELNLLVTLTKRNYLCTLEFVNAWCPCWFLTFSIFCFFSLSPLKFLSALKPSVRTAALLILLITCLTLPRLSSIFRFWGWQFWVKKIWYSMRTILHTSICTVRKSSASREMTSSGEYTAEGMVCEAFYASRRLECMDSTASLSFHLEVEQKNCNICSYNFVWPVFPVSKRNQNR